MGNTSQLSDHEVGATYRNGQHPPGTDVPARLIEEVTDAVIRRSGRRVGNEIKFRCIHPERHTNGDRNPSASWNAAKGVWICHGCGEKGGVYHLGAALGVDVGQYYASRARRTIAAEPTLKSVSIRLSTFAQERHILAQVLQDQFFVRETHHRGRPALRFPTPCGIDRIKYLDHRHQSRQSDYPKATWSVAGGVACWYGLDYALKHLAAGASTLYLVNGEPSVWACAAQDIPAVCTLVGEKPPTESLARELTQALSTFKHPVEVVVVFDTDAAGRQAGPPTAEVLTAAGLNAHVACLPDDLPPGGDVDDLHRRVGENLGKVLATLPRLADTSIIPTEEPQHGTTITAAELLAQEFPEPRYTVEGVLAEDLSLLVASPKTGKTLLLLEWAIAVAGGRNAMGAFPVRRGNVLYLGLEDGPRRLKARLSNLLNGMDPPPGLRFATQWSTFDNGGLADIEAWLQRQDEPRLVVVDTLKRVRPAEKRNRSFYNQDYDALGPLADLAHRYCVSVVVVHHSRKAESSDVLDEVSGTHGLAAAVDGVMILKRTRSNADATLHVVHRDAEDQELALRMHNHPAQWLYAGPACDVQRSEHRNAVLRLLHDHGPLPPKQIAEELNRGHDAVRRLMTDMKRAGEVTSVNGTYEPIVDRPWMPSVQCDSLPTPTHSPHITHSPMEYSDVPPKKRAVGEPVRGVRDACCGSDAPGPICDAPHHGWSGKPI